MSISGPPAYPRATIRLQFNADFTFNRARSLVPYLASMGFSHIYGSPILLARPGSTHGYDIVDHSRLNPEIGTMEEFDALIQTLHEHGMGFILDFVPNHMGVGGADNGWWLDVLEWGPASPYARFFDIDWHPFEKSLEGKVLLPVLGDQYGTVLENGEISLAFSREEGTFSAFCYTHCFPIAIRHYSIILREVIREIDSAGSEAVRSLTDLSRRAVRIGKGSSQPRKQAVEHNEAGDIKRSLATLFRNEPEASHALEAVLRRYNGTPGDPRSYDELHNLLDRQAYRPSYWRVASNEINYRRFFDINDLAAIRMEDPELFELTHGLVFRLLQEHKIQGIRLDHVDGLYNPAEYFERLQQRAAFIVSGRSESEASTARIGQPLYVLVEKILAHHEQLRDSWQVSGTTGYEYLNLLQGLFNDPDGEAALDETYKKYSVDDPSYDQTTLSAKYRVMFDSLASELNVLANRFTRLAKQSRRTRDFSRIGFRNALADTVAHFPVYRTYVDGTGATEEDRRDIAWAVARAKKHTTRPETSIYDFIHDVLTTDLASRKKGNGGRREYRKSEVVDLAMRFQQLTGPVMAKSIEDTAFYRYVRFIARNEVGGDPVRFYSSPQAFHLENRSRLVSSPFSMIATATHDHKRGEDVRMRLAVLSEVPELWNAFADRMTELASFFRSTVDEEPAPSPSDEYLLYQTLAGTWPYELTGPDYAGIEAYTARITEYMLKAAREAKVRTSWTGRNEAYEEAMVRFIESLLSARRGKSVLREIESFVGRIAPAGAVNSLSQLALKLTVPGVPDTYQGCELWDFSLVDPDNRRAVDFPLRAGYRTSWDGDAAYKGLLEKWRNGAVKQYVLARVLDLRSRYPDLFAMGSYEPVEVAGTYAGSVVAFIRQLEDTFVIVVAPRLVMKLLDGAEIPLPVRWEDTSITLPHAEIIDIFTEEHHTVPEDGKLRLSELLRNFPVSALFSRTSA